MRLQNSNTLQAFWLGIGTLSSLALSIVTSAILSRYFNKSDYGTYRQIIYAYSTLLVIFSAGLPNVFSYFLPRYSIQQGKDIVIKITLALFVLGVIFSIALFACSKPIAMVLKNPELEKGLKIFSVIPMLLLPTLGIDGIFATYKKTFISAIYNTITRVLMFFCIVLPIILIKASYEYAIYGWIVVSFFSLFLAFYFQRLPFQGLIVEKSLLKYKDIFMYSLPIAIASIWGIAVRAADQFFISRYFGTEVFAEFSNGFIELPFVGIVTYASSNVILPIFSKMTRDKSGIHEIINLWRSTLKKSATIIYPIVIFFIFNSETIIVLLYSNAYEKSATYFQIALILNFFNIILFSPLMFSIGETKLFAKIHLIFALATWSIEYLIVLVIPSPIGIAICSVTMAILKVFVFITFLLNYFKITISYFIPLRYIFTLIIHSSISLAISKLCILILLSNFSKIESFIANFILYLILLLGTAKMFKLNYFYVLDPIMKKVVKSNRSD